MTVRRACSSCGEEFSAAAIAAWAGAVMAVVSRSATNAHVVHQFTLLVWRTSATFVHD
ncbi:MULTISPECIES: hypothetical protein [unclassified Streptomyces]|uniref:hypothetical protein n=1 Tax=unclassified Streptomyces TaxID=2593676 RepID=UPI0038029E6F